MGGLIRVVVADDDANVRRWLAVALAATGMVEVVGEAADGADAIERAVVLQPDAMVVDLDMPVVDGYTTLVMLRRRLPRIGVVVHTAATDPDLLREIALLGAPVVDKTGDVDAVVAALFQVHHGVPAGL